MAVFDSGWVAIPTNNNGGGGASFNFQHGLGTDKLTGAIYYTDENQNSMISVGTSYDFGSNDAINALLSISDTNATVDLGLDGYATHGGASEWKPFLTPTYIKLILISSEESSPGSGGSSGGSSRWQFLDSPIDIKTETSSSPGNWITIPANSSLTNSTNLLIQGQTTDRDTGGNSNCKLVCRENASGPEVTIIDHDGTSGQRSVAVEQAITPCNSDGSFDIKFTPNGNIAIAHLKIVGYSLSGAVSGGTGDLCRLSAAESGYQMFKNGFTMQWTSSEAISSEASITVNFPVPFSATPFKVTASTRFPKGDSSSQVWFQVTSYDTNSVTLFPQAQNFASWSNPVYADIIAIGITEPTNCPGSGGGETTEGTKISQLAPATELKDDDLFVLSKDDESDGIYDHSNKITFQQIKENILPDTQGSSTITLIAPKLIKADTVGGAWNAIPFEQIDLSDDLPIGAQGCILQVEAFVSGPNDNVHAEIFLRKEENSTTQYKILYTSAFGGGDAVAGNYQGFYPIHEASRSIWIGIPQRGPDRYEVYLVGYF